MAYNEELAQRIRQTFSADDGFEEKKMFGGLAFMLGGNMVCGITKDDLMARIGPDAHEAALERPGARPMDFTGRPMKGIVFVGPEGYASDDDLRSWLEATLAFATTLPPKESKPKSGVTRKRAKS